MSKIKQTITYTNGIKTARYFNNTKESQQSMAITMQSPVVYSINPEIISEEQYQAELMLTLKEGEEND